MDLTREMPDSDYDRFSWALDQTAVVLNDYTGDTQGTVPQFLLHLLYDSYRTAHAAKVLIDFGYVDPRVPADAVELLARKMVEAAILCRYVRKHASDEIVDRFLRTYNTEWEKAWQLPPASGFLPTRPAKNLPPYRTMAEDVRGDIYDLYRKLSYFGHPRGALPYCVEEARSGLSRREFFRRRIRAILPVLVDLLVILTSNFRESQDQASS